MNKRLLDTIFILLYTISQTTSAMKMVTLIFLQLFGFINLAKYTTV